MFFLEENSSFSEIFLTYASKKQREEASRSNDLHPPKPKRNMGKRTFLKVCRGYLFQFFTQLG